MVSDEATVGIYNYRSGRDFCELAEAMITCNDRSNGEFYVAPVYTYMYERDRARIGVFNVGEEANGMYGLGTPEDLDLFKSLPVCQKRSVSNSEVKILNKLTCHATHPIRTRQKLKHVFVKRRFCINETMFRQPNNTMLISFSPVEGNISTRKFIVNGTSRFMNEFDGDVALINVQNDSALYAHLLWDVAHQLKVGQYLYIKEAIATESMLERAYYHEAFQRIETSESGFDIYEKYSDCRLKKSRG